MLVPGSIIRRIIKNNWDGMRRITAQNCCLCACSWATSSRNRRAERAKKRRPDCHNLLPRCFLLVAFLLCFWQCRCVTGMRFWGFRDFCIAVNRSVDDDNDKMRQHRSRKQQEGPWTALRHCLAFQCRDFVNVFDLENSGPEIELQV